VSAIDTSKGTYRTFFLSSAESGGRGKRRPPGCPPPASRRLGRSTRRTPPVSSSATPTGRRWPTSIFEDEPGLCRYSALVLTPCQAPVSCCHPHSYSSLRSKSASLRWPNGSPSFPCSLSFQNPVERFDLVINLKTATALGLDVPTQLHAPIWRQTRRRTSSPATRPGASPPTSPSCRRCYASEEVRRDEGLI
jgi:hypothetical protein